MLEKMEILHIMQKKTLTASILFLVLAVSACKKSNPFDAGAESIEALVSGVTGAMAANDHDKLRSLMIRKHEYVNSIHPHTPEAKDMSGEDYWQTFIIRRRDALTGMHIDLLKGKSCKAVITGKESKRETHGPVVFYREIPVRIECTAGGKMQLSQNRGLFGIVVEKYGVYKLLNIFAD